MTTMPHKGEPTPALLNRVADILLRRVGLHLGNDRRSDLLLAVRNRVTALQLPSAEAYAACLADDADHTEFAALVDEVTVGETYFFRVRSFFDVFRTRVLPPLLLRKRAEGDTLRIWCAASASGEEPYSVAITLMDLGVDLHNGEAEILATDISQRALQRAEEAVYSSWSFRGVPLDDHAVRRHFSPQGSRFNLSEDVRRGVRFERFNLASAPYPHPKSGENWDIVFLRNVLMYFPSLVVQRVLANTVTSLSPQGFLFIGECESLSHLPSPFVSEELEGVYMYRPRPESGVRTFAQTASAAVGETGTKGQSANGAPSPKSTALPASTVRPPILGRVSRPSTTPSDLRIAGHPQRVPEAPSQADQTRSLPLLRSIPGVPLQTPFLAAERHQARLIQMVTDYVRAEQHGLAVAALGQVLARAPEDVDSILMLGFIHLNRGENASAHALGQEAIKHEPLCGRAYVLRGLASFFLNDLGATENELRQALYLVPGCALASFFLARVREAQGQLTAAKRMYEQALEKARAHTAEFLQLGFERLALIRALEAKIGAGGT